MLIAKLSHYHVAITASIILMRLREVQQVSYKLITRVCVCLGMVNLSIKCSVVQINYSILNITPNSISIYHIVTVILQDTIAPRSWCGP